MLEILKSLCLHLVLQEFYQVASSSYQAVLSGRVAFAPVELPGLRSRRDPTGLSEGLQALFITRVGTLKAF